MSLNYYDCVKLLRESKKNASPGLLKKLLCFDSSDSWGERLFQIDVTPAELIVIEMTSNSIPHKTAEITFDELYLYMETPNSLACFLCWKLFKYKFSPDDEVYEAPVQQLELPKIKSFVRDSKVTSRTSKITTKISAGKSVRLVGKSASGKTFVAYQVVSALHEMGWGVSWHDLSIPGSHWLSVLTDVVLSPRDQNILMVIDDSQSSPTEAAKLSELYNFLSLMVNGKIFYLVLAWDTFGENLQNHFPNSQLVSCFGDDVFSEIFETNNSDKTKLREVRKRSSGDLVVATLQLEDDVSSALLSEFELAEKAFLKLIGKAPIDENARKIIFKIAALNQFEIDVSINVFRYKDQKDIVDLLLGKKIIRQNSGYLSVGHRSFSRLLVSYLSNRYPELESEFGSPNSIAVNYIKSSPPEQLLITLERLDLISLAESEQDLLGTKFLASLWKSLKVLVGIVSRQTEIDPTWGNNLASAIFAARALIGVSDPAWFAISNYLYSEGPFLSEQDIKNRIIGTIEKLDFERIHDCMAEADRQNLPQLEWYEHSEDVNFDAMHRAWISGLMLGFEGVSTTSDASTVKAIKESLEASQDADGSYHPKRVPWVTARALLGLAAIGESIYTNESVRLGCEWLRTSFPNGPNQIGTWNGGTGTWNNKLGTTALCLSALIKCGVSIDDRAITSGLAYLQSMRKEWVKPGMEIDCALSLSTLLRAGGSWRNYEVELEHLFNWIKKRQSWDFATLNSIESNEESCKIAQVSEEIMSIVWIVVSSDLPLLLKDLISIDFEDTKVDKADQTKLSKLLAAIATLTEQVKKQLTERQDVLNSNAPDVNDLAKIKEQHEYLTFDLKTLNKYKLDIEAVSSRGEFLMINLDEINSLGRKYLPATWVKTNF